LQVGFYALTPIDVFISILRTAAFFYTAAVRLMQYKDEVRLWWLL
jgi:hypothetical protein